MIYTFAKVSKSRILHQKDAAKAVWAWRGRSLNPFSSLPRGSLELSVYCFCPLNMKARLVAGKCWWQVRECVCWVMAGRTDGVFVLSTVFFHSATTNEAQRDKKQRERTCLSGGEHLCKHKCACCSPCMFTVVWNLKWSVYAYTRVWAWMITADDQSFSALVTERDRAVNLRWLEATGKLNELSTARLNAPMLRAIQGATTRYAGDASHLHRYKHRLRAAINLQQVLQTIHIVGGWVNFLFWSFRGQI